MAQRVLQNIRFGIELNDPSVLRDERGYTYLLQQRITDLGLEIEDAILEENPAKGIQIFVESIQQLLQFCESFSGGLIKNNIDLIDLKDTSLLLLRRFAIIQSTLGIHRSDRDCASIKQLLDDVADTIEQTILKRMSPRFITKGCNSHDISLKLRSILFILDCHGVGDINTDIHSSWGRVKKVIEVQAAKQQTQEFERQQHCESPHYVESYCHGNPYEASVLLSSRQQSLQKLKIEIQNELEAYQTDIELLKPHRVWINRILSELEKPNYRFKQPPTNKLIIGYNVAIFPFASMQRLQPKQGGFGDYLHYSYAHLLGTTSLYEHSKRDLLHLKLSEKEAIILVRKESLERFEPNIPRRPYSDVYRYQIQKIPPVWQ